MGAVANFSMMFYYLLTAAPHVYPGNWRKAKENKGNHQK